MVGLDLGCFRWVGFFYVVMVFVVLLCGGLEGKCDLE